MSGMSFQETRRLFGPSNNPANDTNARHCAFLRKGLELFTPEQLQATFDQPTKLRLTMGSGMNSNAFGQIKTHFIRNERLAYDDYFFKRGNDYSVHNVHALPALQTAERHPQLAFPTPPPTSPVANETPPVRPRLPALIPAGSRLLPIDLTADVDQHLPKNKTKKRKRSATIEVIDVSDSEDDCPRKKIQFLGFVDLTQ
ncbi:hypothetical protein C8R44DRAFT_888109 [Mycena epipterygia]|nr:hypothetical protein C8R44DRAFT_888109 [Mycena epipterygia]